MNKKSISVLQKQVNEPIDLDNSMNTTSKFNETNLSGLQVNSYDLTKKMIDDLLNGQWLSASVIIVYSLLLNIYINILLLS